MSAGSNFPNGLWDEFRRDDLQRDVLESLRQLRVAGRPFRKLPLAVIRPPRSVPVRSMVAVRLPSAWLRISISMERSPDFATWQSKNILTFFSRPIVHWLTILLPLMVPLA